MTSGIPMNQLVRSPLRYPGGKFFDLPVLLHLVPPFEEYREPMVGAGNMFLNLKSRFPQARFWINDIDEDLIRFYLCLQKEAGKVYHLVMQLKESFPNLRNLFDHVRSQKPKNDVEHAAFYFLFSRLSFNALALHNPHSGISERCAGKNFSRSIIARLLLTGRLLQNVKITNLDFEEVLNEKSTGKTFIFLDPPYYGITRLYRIGDDFPHQRLSSSLRQIHTPNTQWMLTYNDVDDVRKMYEGYLIVRWERKHRMAQHLFDKRNYQIAIMNYLPPRFQMKLFEDDVHSAAF